MLCEICVKILTKKNICDVRRFPFAFQTALGFKVLQSPFPHPNKGSVPLVESPKNKRQDYEKNPGYKSEMPHS